MLKTFRSPFLALAFVLIPIAVAFAVGFGETPQAKAPPRQAAAAQSSSPQSGSPAAPNPLRSAYFGDLHVHTSWSLDAFNQGNRLNDPTVAYRYGRGDVVTGPN